MESMRHIQEGQGDKSSSSLVRGFNTSRWSEFQDGLSRLLDVSISLNDEKGDFIVPPSLKSGGGIIAKGAEEFGEYCGAEYRGAALRALNDGDTHIFKCQPHMYAFAMPVFLDGRSFVLIGGRRDVRVRYGSKGPGPDGAVGPDGERVPFSSGGARSASFESLFSLPDTFKRLAVPFLESLYNSPVTRPIAGDLSGIASYEGEFSGLLDIYRSISTVIDKDSLYDMLIARSCEFIGAERASIMIFDKASKSYRIKASIGMEKSIADSVRIKSGQGVSGRTAAKGVPFLVKDIEREVPWHKSLRTYGTGSFISVPLKLYDRVIGVINLADKRGGGIFTDEDLFVLLSISHYATIALERGAYYSMSERLKTISMTDPLTGLYNRRFFKNRLFEETERVRRLRASFAVFIIDVDDFKFFNDTWGHQTGDNVLKLIAKTIKDAVRTVDVVVRYGGEEFAVILPHTSKLDSVVIAERIRAGVEKLKLSEEIASSSPTISIGIAEFPGDARNTDDLIYRADAAMYHAKRKGKNRVVLYEK